MESRGLVAEKTNVQAEFRQDTRKKSSFSVKERQKQTERDGIAVNPEQLSSRQPVASSNFHQHLNPQRPSSGKLPNEPD